MIPAPSSSPTSTTTAEVDGESDYCCTSGNAKSVIDAIPPEQEILFLPDMYLGLWLEKMTGRKLTIWLGECHVHAGIRPADIERWQAEAPDAELLVHPECRAVRARRWRSGTSGRKILRRRR